MSNSQAGQRAIVKLQGISALAAAIRADLKAMEHLQRLAPGQDWGAVYPLRRVATLQKLFGPLESMTEEDAKDEGVAEILENTTDIKELEDGDAGMLALWGLLNLSTYEKAQRHIARHAIFSLLKMTYLSPNPTKASVASHILTHIRRNSENVTVFYRAELHLKTKFLVGASGVPDHDRELKKLEPPQLLGHDLPPSLIAGGEDGLETILEVDESEMQAVNDNQRARLQFLQWAGNPDQGPESLITLAKTDRGEDSIPRYLVDAEERARARAKSSGHRSRRDQRSMTEYQDKLEDALADFGSIRSYRGEYLRATLFQSLQAHCSSMWRYAANLNEKMTATEEQEEDETVNDDFLHPDDQAFLSDLRRSEQHHGGKQSVRELRSASAKQPARRPGSAMPPGSKTQLPARPAAEQKKSLAARPSPRNARPKSGAGGALPPTPLRNRKTPSASGVPHAPVAQPPKTPHLLSGGQGPYRHGLKSTSAASTGKTASNHRRPSTAPSRGATESVAGMTPRPPPLSVVKEMAKVCPSLMTLEHKPSPSPPSVAGPRPSSAAIAPRSLSSRPVSSQVRSLQESRQGHSADSVRGRSSSPAGSNWTPKVEFYAQDSVPPFNPPDVSRRLLTADCPEEVEKKLVTASSRLAKDPSLLKDLLRPPSPSRSPTTGPATPALPRIKGASTGGGVGESLTAMVSAEDVASDLNSYAEDQASALAREKIGWDIHLQRPQTGYSNPHTGVIRPLGERISSLWDPEIPLSLQRSEAEMGRIPKDLPRPVTMLTGSGDDASKAKSPAATKAQLMARGIKEEHADKYIQEQEGKQQEGSKYLKVAVGVHEKEPHAVYAFKETGVSGSTAPIIVFEHVDGCKFCEELFGHFLLPNGKLAHYYHQNPHDRRGRFVSMSAPPSPAYTLKDLLQAAFLLPPEFIKDLRHPGRPVMEFAKLTAFPLPPLAPVPVRSTLTVRPSRRDDERFPRGWRLSQGAGMGFTATPERVDRMDTLVIKLADDIVDQFDLKSSVFAERETECDARSFFDSPAVVKEQAEKDVSQLDRRVAGFALGAFPYCAAVIGCDMPF